MIVYDNRAPFHRLVFHQAGSVLPRLWPYLVSAREDGARARRAPLPGAWDRPRLGRYALAVSLVLHWTPQALAPFDFKHPFALQIFAIVLGRPRASGSAKGFLFLFPKSKWEAAPSLPLGRWEQEPPADRAEQPRGSFPLDAWSSTKCGRL